jgi:hypothetical protein
MIYIDADENQVRIGLIGETYRVNSTHLKYCETDNWVPHVWTANSLLEDAPKGEGQFVVLKTVSYQPKLVALLDTIMPMVSTNGYESSWAIIPKITFFACE